MWAKILLVSLASCAHGVPVELLANGRLISHAVPAVPTLTELRLVPTATSAAPVSPARLVSAVVNPRDEEGYDPHPQYNFGYSIADTLTGDSKTREESRDGDVVTGSYSVADPDGRIRTVTYTADPVHGFQAKVTYDGAEGPVAIPFNAPATKDIHVATTPVVAAAPVVAAQAVDDEEATVIAARTPNQTVQQLRAFQAVPLRTVAAAPAAVHAVHTAAVPATVVRHHNVVATADPAISVVRTADGNLHAVHAGHHVAAAPSVVTAVRQIPEAVHAVHTVAGAPAVVRSDAVHAVHAVPHTVHHVDTGANVAVIRNAAPQSLRTVLANSGLDLSQFRFVSPVSLLN